MRGLYEGALIIETAFCESNNFCFVKVERCHLQNFWHLAEAQLQKILFWRGCENNLEKVVLLRDQDSISLELAATVIGTWLL